MPNPTHKALIEEKQARRTRHEEKCDDFRILILILVSLIRIFTKVRE